MKSDITAMKHILKLEKDVVPTMQRLTIWFSFAIAIAFIAWAAVVTVDEVAEAPGEIIPVGYVKKVQHFDSGTIQAILVKDGSQVFGGDPLLRLDTTLQTLRKQELESQLKALSKKENIVREQLSISQSLMEKQLQSRMNYLSIKSQLTDLELRIIQMQEELLKVEHSLDFSIIRAPADGIVHGLQAHTVGGVIEAGKTIMEIVPHDRKLIAEVRISSNDIGHVKTGDSVELKFATYDYGRYGGIRGVLTEISVSTFLDPRGVPYYRGLVTLEKTALGDSDAKHPVLPGMTISGEIKTGSKTILEYLLKPIYSSAKKAMRER
jgi:multidrug efflux pump subunit AcrA (membrane-fusion protein)